MLDSTTGSFTGFPTAFVYKNTIYLAYRYNCQHMSILGKEQDTIYYKYSRNNGRSWSDRKKLVFPPSSQPGIYYDYRSLYVVSDHDHLYGLGVIAPSDSSSTKAYQSFYCSLNVDERGELSLDQLSCLPYVSPDGKKLSAASSLANGRLSNVISGNFIIHDHTIYWCNYNSLRNIQLLSWKISSTEVPNEDSVKILTTIGDNGKTGKYSEAGMFLHDNTINMSIRDEDSTNKNFAYNLLSGKTEYLCNTQSKAFGPMIFYKAGYPILLSGRQYGYLKGKEQLTRMDNLIILNSDNTVKKENIGFVGHLMGGDSMYCSMVESDGRLFVFYYYGMNSSEVSATSSYYIAYKTIKMRHLIRLCK